MTAPFRIDSRAQSLGDVLRDFVIRHIENVSDRSEKKQRIMVAYQHGHISAGEAEAWIKAEGLEQD